MKALQISFVFGFLLVLFCTAAKDCNLKVRHLVTQRATFRMPTQQKQIPEYLVEQLYKTGFHFFGPYDVYKTRAARWQAPRAVVNTAEPGNDNDNNFPNSADSVQDYYKIISYLNDVGKRRR